MTMEKDFRKLDRSKWIEVERNTRNSKKWVSLKFIHKWVLLNYCNFILGWPILTWSSESIHLRTIWVTKTVIKFCNFALLVQIEASLRSQEPISGIYYELEDQEDVWKLTTSVYLNGKFVTEWKNATLPGWYDRIGPEIFMSRHLVRLAHQLNQQGRIRTKPINRSCSFTKSPVDGMSVQIRAKRSAGYFRVFFHVKNG